MMIAGQQRVPLCLSRTRMGIVGLVAPYTKYKDGSPWRVQCVSLLASMDFVFSQTERRIKVFVTPPQDKQYKRKSCR